MALNEMFCNNIWFPAWCDHYDSSVKVKIKRVIPLIPYQKSSLRGLEMLILARCGVCMVISCSSMLCWQPSGFSMHTHTHTKVCLRSLSHVFNRFFRCVCMYRGGGIFFEQATLQGWWTHLSTLVMKEPTPGAQQVVSCIILRGSYLLLKLWKALNFNFTKDCILHFYSWFCVLNCEGPPCSQRPWLPTMLTHSNKSRQCTALNL